MKPLLKQSVLCAVIAFMLISCLDLNEDELKELFAYSDKIADSTRIADSLDQVRFSQYVPDFDTIEVSGIAWDIWYSYRVLPSGIVQSALSDVSGKNIEYRTDTLAKRDLYDLEKKVRMFLPVSSDTTIEPDSNSQADRRRFGMLFSSHKQRKLIYDFRRGFDPHIPMRVFFCFHITNSAREGTITQEKYRFYTKEKMKLDREIDYSKYDPH